MSSQPAQIPPPPDPTSAFAESTSDALRALAGPGTGKTYALVRRLAALLDVGVDPSDILVVTFARTAAKDLVSAVAVLEAAGGELIPRTLHSFCFAILGKQHVLQATGRRPRILLTFERDILIKDLPDTFGGVTNRRKLVAAFEAAWARRQTEAPGAPVPGLDQSFQDALIESLRWHRAMLVGEVVPIALNYLEHNPQAEERNAYRHVLVDEYQDLNRAEQAVLNLLSAESNIAVIGDDDQSIYAFKHANPEGIREFHVDHPGTEDVEFVICRRCPKRVVTMAQTIVERNPGRARGPLEPKSDNPDGEIHNVQFRSIEEEAGGIADFVRHKINAGAAPGQCLILANSRAVGYAIRDAIRARGVPCSSFFREEPVDSLAAQEALTLLTLLADHDDRVALRAWLAFGSTTERRPAYRRVYAAAREQNTDVKDMLGRLDRGEMTLPYTGAAVDRYRELLAILDNLEQLRDDLPALVDRLLPEDAEDLRLLREAALPAADEAEELVSLATMLRYGVAQRETPLESTEVRVMSMHASKGLTADLVVLAGLVDGVMPRVDDDLPPAEHEAQLQEQRRVFFVGLTRTRRILVLSSYSQLERATAFRLQVRRGPALGYEAFRTFATPFLAELGEELPQGIRGEDWVYE